MVVATGSNPVPPTIFSSKFKYLRQNFYAALQQFSKLGGNLAEAPVEGVLGEAQLCSILRQVCRNISSKKS
jgi:hypothetical protein